MSDLQARKDALVQAAWLRAAYQTRWARLRCRLLHRWRWWGAIEHIRHCYRCGAFVQVDKGLLQRVADSNRHGEED